MGKLVKYVAQTAQDDFEQNYAAGTSFFTLNDYIVRVGNAAADFYRNGWKQSYDEMRAEGKKEVVAFDPTTLSEQFVKVKKDNETGQWAGALEKQAMSLPFDQQTSGYQNVFDAKTGEELERSNTNETWQYEYQPLNNRKFFRIDRSEIKVFTKWICNLRELRILYVPSITIGDGDEELPDGIVGYCIATTVMYMRANADKKIIKKSLDGNQNEILETEMNPNAVPK